MARFRIADAPIDVALLRQGLLTQQAGALASFEGMVRDNNNGRLVEALSYEAYQALAEAEGERIIDQARERFAIIDAACVHRIGRLQPGEPAVWVGVSAGHRDAAFAACRWIIDEVKARVPVWKHEHYAQGGAEWLHPGPEGDGG